MVGAAKGAGGALELRYQPIDLPLADVVNAWMFLESADDQKKFSAHGGLFRPIEGDQLYKLYDTENYYCGGYDSKQPARPYFVTTDIFWEVYGAAYEGVFMTAERQQAMPAFKTLLENASRELAASAPKSRMAGAFAAASAVIVGQVRSQPGGGENRRRQRLRNSRTCWANPWTIRLSRRAATTPRTMGRKPISGPCAI